MISFNLLGAISNTTIWIIIGIVAVLMILLCIFNKLARLIVGLILVVVLLFTGVCATYYDIQYFIAQGQVVGTDVEGKHNETIVVYDGYTKFTYSAFGFDSNGNTNEYICKTKFDNTTIDFSYCNGTSVNDIECLTKDSDEDFIKTVYSVCFIDSEGSAICSDDLYISIYSYSNSIEVEIKTKGGDNAVRCWKRYLGKNGFVLKINNVSDLPVNSTIETNIEPWISLITINCHFDNTCEIGKSVVARIVNIDTSQSWSKVILITQETLTNGYSFSLRGVSCGNYKINFSVPSKYYGLTSDGEFGVKLPLVEDGEVLSLDFYFSKRQ